MLEYEQIHGEDIKTKRTLESDIDAAIARRAPAIVNVADFGAIKIIIAASGATAEQKTRYTALIDEQLSIWNDYLVNENNKITAIKANMQSVTDKVTANAKLSAEEKAEFTDANTVVQGK